MTLTSSAVQGSIWVFLEKFGQQVVQLILFIILARLLSPSEFGLIGLVTIFFAIAQKIVDSGLEQALIRLEHISKEERSTVFWFNLFLSIVIYGLLFLLAPYIASFFEQPQLTDLLRFMGVAILFFGLAIIQRALLTHGLEFKQQTIAQLIAAFLAGSIGVALAIMGYGVWALAWQFVLLSFFSTIILWMLKPTAVQFIFSKKAFSRLFGFGYKLLLSGLLDSVYQNIYSAIIGKSFTPTSLGYYTQAKKMRDLSSTNLAAIVQKITYPFLSKKQTDLPLLKRSYKKVIQYSSFIIFPSLILLIIFAQPTLVFVLGEKWKEATFFLQILSISGMMFHIHAINLNVLKVLGRSDLFLKLEIIKKLITTVVIVISIQFGIKGLLLGQVFTSFVAYFINAIYSTRFLNYSYREQLLDIFSVLALVIPMVLVGFSLQYFFPVVSLVQLAIYVAIAGIIHVIFTYTINSRVSTGFYTLLLSSFPFFNKVKT